MRDRLDRALDRNPGYPPGFSLRHLEENLNRRDAETQRREEEVETADYADFKSGLRAKNSSAKSA
jgi:hypothetical protein